VIIGDGGFGTLQARIPEPDGETVITRYTLWKLLDRLDELTTGPNDQPAAVLADKPQSTAEDRPTLSRHEPQLSHEFRPVEDKPEA